MFVFCGGLASGLNLRLAVEVAEAAGATSEAVDWARFSASVVDIATGRDSSSTLSEEEIGMMLSVISWSSWIHVASVEEVGKDVGS